MTPKLRPLARAAYAVAFLLIVIPLAETMIGLWPFRIGQVSWRFGAAGLISRSVITPLLGLLVAIATATFAGHPKRARALGLLAWIGAALGVIAMVMFGLDALQTRAAVESRSVTVFDVTAAIAFAKYVLGTFTAILLGIGGWRGADFAAGRRRAQPAGRADSPNPRVLLDDQP